MTRHCRSEKPLITTFTFTGSLNQPSNNRTFNMNMLETEQLYYPPPPVRTYVEEPCEEEEDLYTNSWDQEETHEDSDETYTNNLGSNRKHYQYNVVADVMNTPTNLLFQDMFEIPEIRAVIM